MNLIGDKMAICKNNKQKPNPMDVLKEKRQRIMDKAEKNFEDFVNLRKIQIEISNLRLRG